MFVFLNSTLQVLQKNLSIKQHIEQTVIIYMDAVSFKSICFWSLLFTIYYCLSRSFDMYKIFQRGEQNM